MRVALVILTAFVGLASATPAFATGNNLTMSSGSAFGTSGAKFGSGDLTAGYGSVPIATCMPQTSGASYTLEVWAQISSTPSGAEVAFGGQNVGWVGVGKGGVAEFGPAGPTSPVVTTTVINDGNWHLEDLVVTSSGSFFYVDGTQVSSSTATYNGSQPNPIEIGSYDYNGGQSSAWLGYTDEASCWTGAKYTANFSPPTAAYQGTEANIAGLWHLDGNGTDSSQTSNLTILPNNPAIVYSPGNWTAATSLQAISINSGAYIRMLFTGTTCNLVFSTGNDGAPLPQIYWRTDAGAGGQGWTEASVASTVPCTPSASNAQPWHLLEMKVKSTSQNLNRWSSTPASGVYFGGVQVASNASVAKPYQQPVSVWFFGDSITEGVSTPTTATSQWYTGSAYTSNDNTYYDAMGSWALYTGEMLGAEYGIIGFGGSGLTATGGGGVPVLSSSYNLVIPGQPRTNCPTMIVENEGTNDTHASNSTVQSAEVTMLNNWMAECPQAKIAVLEPFNASENTALSAAVSQVNSPLVTYVSTAGFFNTNYGIDTLGFHPTSSNDSAFIGPEVVNALQAILRPAGGAPQFHSGFH